jgi:uncharacterized protein YacL
MKNHTQLAFFGTIAMVIAQIISFLSYRIFESYGDIIYYVVQFVDFFGMLCIANFFYQLYQKQNQKINSVTTKSENPFENQ